MGGAEAWSLKAFQSAAAASCLMLPKEREALSGQCSSLSGASNFGVRVKVEARGVEPLSELQAMAGPEVALAVSPWPPFRFWFWQDFGNSLGDGRHDKINGQNRARSVLAEVASVSVSDEDAVTLAIPCHLGNFGDGDRCRVNLGKSVSVHEGGHVFNGRRVCVVLIDVRLSDGHLWTGGIPSAPLVSGRQTENVSECGPAAEVFGREGTAQNETAAVLQSP